MLTVEQLSVALRKQCDFHPIPPQPPYLNPNTNDFAIVLRLARLPVNPEAAGLNPSPGSFCWLRIEINEAYRLRYVLVGAKEEEVRGK